MNSNAALWNKLANRLLVFTSGLVFIVNGCGQAPVYDLAGKRLPAKGAEVAAFGHGENVYVANSEQTDQDFTKLADIPPDQVNAGINKAVNEDSAGYDEFMKQAMETEAQHLISEGRMFKLADGTQVRVLDYYKNIGIAPQDRLVSLSSGDKQQAWSAKIQVMEGEHKGQIGIITAAQLNGEQP